MFSIVIDTKFTAVNWKLSDFLFFLLFVKSGKRPFFTSLYLWLQCDSINAKILFHWSQRNKVVYSRVIRSDRWVWLRISTPSQISPKRLDFGQVGGRTVMQVLVRTLRVQIFMTTAGQRVALHRNHWTVRLMFNSKAATHLSVSVWVCVLLICLKDFCFEWSRT